jgi:hypothetical protein
MGGGIVGVTKELLDKEVIIVFWGLSYLFQDGIVDGGDGSYGGRVLPSR